jgi:ubiquinone/menaquinone biosynthesis C-methylase UbiE
MKTDSGKQWNEAASAYANMAADRNADAYEYDINFPSILNLLPKDKKSLLDVGTGSGDFIPELSSYFSDIDGSDVSPNMVEIAKERFPDYNFHVWDLEENSLAIKNTM